MFGRLSNIFDGKALGVPAAKLSPTQNSPSSKNLHTLNEPIKRKKAVEIQRENEHLLKKVVEAKSDLSYTKMKQDWKQKQRYTDIVKQGRTLQETILMQTKKQHESIAKQLLLNNTGGGYSKNNYLKAKKNDPHINMGVNSYIGAHPDAAQRSQFMTIADF